MRVLVIPLLTLGLAACASKSKTPSVVVTPAGPPINPQKERSHFMNVSPSVAVGHFVLKERLCAVSTYWYSNLLDYVRPRDLASPVDKPVVLDDLVISADGTFKRTREVKGKAREETTGLVTTMEQGPTKIVALTKGPKNEKSVSDQQAHHKIELSLKEDVSGAVETWSLDLVQSNFERMVAVSEAKAEVCGARDSLVQVFERVKN